MTARTARARWAPLAVLLVVFTLTVLAAGQRAAPPPEGGVQRLGPDSGELVADYLWRAAESLPAPGSGVQWALVQLDGYLSPAAAAGEVRGAALSSVVFRVPLPGVQTALIFHELSGQHPAAELAAAMRTAALDRADAAARAAPGSRRAAVASAEATRLRAGCACVLALVIRADGAMLHDLAGRVGIRAVQAAVPGTAQQDLAVSPLLPEQHDLVGPVPDGGVAVPP